MRLDNKIKVCCLFAGFYVCLSDDNNQPVIYSFDFGSSSSSSGRFQSGDGHFVCSAIVCKRKDKLKTVV